MRERIFGLTPNCRAFLQPDGDYSSKCAESDFEDPGMIVAAYNGNELMLKGVVEVVHCVVPAL